MSYLEEARQVVRTQRNRQRGLPDSHGAPDEDVILEGLGIGGMNPYDDWSPLDNSIELDASTPVKWLDW